MVGIDYWPMVGIDYWLMVGIDLSPPRLTRDRTRRTRHTTTKAEADIPSLPGSGYTPPYLVDIDLREVQSVSFSCRTSLSSRRGPRQHLLSPSLARIPTSRPGGPWADARHHVDGALCAATSIPPVSQFTRTSKPVPSRDSTIVPPHDIPVAKKLIVERAGRSLQMRGKSALMETSPGICMTRPVAPERIVRPGASIWALT